MNVPILSGEEAFSFQTEQEQFAVKDFWAWDSSNLLSNTLRGALAEFIVAKALGIELQASRNDWTEYDLLYRGKYRIEVKSSAYLQAWDQHKLSEIRFSIAPARSWTSEQCYDNNQLRHSDLYVFCLFACKEREQANPLRLDQWEFYVLPTEVINSKFGIQKSLSLKTLMGLSPSHGSYRELKEITDAALSATNP